MYIYIFSKTQLQMILKQTQQKWGLNFLNLYLCNFYRTQKEQVYVSNGNLENKA